MNLYIETLGCAKNQVDSEIMSRRLLQAGFFLTDDPSQATVIVVNTCSFIASAINESVDTILELSQFKKDGICKNMVVVGCLPERFREEIIETLPEVDIFLGTGALDKIVPAVQLNLSYERCILPDPAGIKFADSLSLERKVSHVAYLKISEGCNRECSYCIIPKLKGRQRSRNMNQIIDEAKDLIESGTREITLVAQDTTSYGNDLLEGYGLDVLLENLANLSKDVWIRFLYGHPETITNSVIRTVALHDNLCSYFDLPIQHVSNNVLKRMKRLSTKKSLVSLINKIRRNVPEAVLRTTLLVGFPGETASDFMELVDFLNTVRFDNLGVFTYSDFEDLPAHFLSNHVDRETALLRHDTLMSKQLEISCAKLSSFVGKTINILIESFYESNVYLGRSMMQAPEVDGITYVHTSPNNEIAVGSVIPVKIIDSLEYDLIGELP